MFKFSVEKRPTWKGQICCQKQHFDPSYNFIRPYNTLRIKTYLNLLSLNLFNCHIQTDQARLDTGSGCISLLYVSESFHHTYRIYIAARKPAMSVLFRARVSSFLAGVAVMGVHATYQLKMHLVESQDLLVKEVGAKHHNIFKLSSWQYHVILGHFNLFRAVGHRLDFLSIHISWIYIAGDEHHD